MYSLEYPTYSWIFKDRSKDINVVKGAAQNMSKDYLMKAKLKLETRFGMKEGSVGNKKRHRSDRGSKTKKQAI